MFGKRVRTYALIGAAAVVGVLAAVVPALGDSDEDAVRLHMAADGLYFSYGGQQQALSETRCELNAPDTSGPVLVEVDGTAKGAGLNSLGMGVKTGGAQGTPCGRVDGAEQLTLELANGTGSPLEGRSWHQLRLDLELKGDAWVVLDMYVGDAQTPTATFELVSGASIAASGADPATDVNPDGGYRVDSTTPGVYACAAVSDSGPDSGPNDNCQWNIDPVTVAGGDIVFDKIVLSVNAGEFSLEGSGDFGSDPANDSLFFIANAVPVANDDSAITAKNTPVTVTVLSNDTDADGDTLSVDPLSVTSPTSNGGAVTLNGDGTITYTPDTVFVGTDSITYRATDGSATSNVATVTVRVDDTIGCNAPKTITKLGVTATYTMYPDTSCDEKLVHLDVIETSKDGVPTPIPTVVFQPRPVGGSPVDCSILPRPGGCTDEFEGVITFLPRDAGNPSNTGLLEYDPSDNDQFNWRTMLWCDADPQFGAVSRPEIEMILPGPVDPSQPEQGESWCIVSETTSIDSEGKTVTTWTTFGIGDPFKRLS